MDNNDFLEDNIPQEENDLSGTQELDSVSDYISEIENTGGIMPRERFTDLNNTDDNEKTRMMDSVVPDSTPVYEQPASAANPVKKRRRRKKKKKQMNHTRTFGQIFLGGKLERDGVV